MASFHTTQGIAVDLDSFSSAEVAEMMEAAVANVVGAALEFAPTSDAAELAEMARGWIEALDRPSLARVCGSVSARGPRDTSRLIAGVLLTTYQRGAR
ncbi:hypothetical protein SAMN02745121_04525 [Nannocystis exedens]|uniref:Uncharacterized protein n=1 Tax=Nannocystis exedens TaxID=54 RepID=A0A1I2B8B6_9BACT|nr:hypothetical protein [Nannocystis exedens]PCC68130.1 hypothetical protein NAEX_01139 [Nannocystis exedens]SFE52391.1 hypothetical protein SAMN02745121_04525 [Nannocystis exedens]